MTGRTTFVVGMILMAALSRLIQHEPNFTSTTAMALFGGAYLATRRMGVIVPLAALLISDAALEVLTRAGLTFGWMAKGQGFYRACGLFMQPLRWSRFWVLLSANAKRFRQSGRRPWAVHCCFSSSPILPCGRVGCTHNRNIPRTCKDYCFAIGRPCLSSTGLFWETAFLYFFFSAVSLLRNK